MRNIDPFQENPSVSVVIPAYNAEATLAETLRSVEAQTFQDFDLIIVDDGSTDQTPQIAKAFCGKHCWARYLQQDNQGVAKARNKGVSASSGTYIAPLDADDLWHPNYLDEMIETVRAAKIPPVLIYAFSKVIDRNSFIIGSGHSHTVHGDAWPIMHYLNLVGNGSAMMVDRAALIDVGGYDPQLRAAGVEGCEDWLLQLKLAYLGPIACTPKYLVGYRRDGTGMSACKSTMHRSSMLTRQIFDNWLTERGDERTASRLSNKWVKSAQNLNAARVHVSERKPWRALVAFGHAVLLDPFGMIGNLAYKPISASKRVMRIVRPKAPFSSISGQSTQGSHGSFVVSRRIKRLQSFILLRNDQGQRQSPV